MTSDRIARATGKPNGACLSRGGGPAATDSIPILWSACAHRHDEAAMLLLAHNQDEERKFRHYERMLAHTHGPINERIKAAAAPTLPYAASNPS